MRRYADLINQRMLAWAIDVIESFAETIANNLQDIPQEKILHALWDHACILLGKTSRLMKSGSKRTANHDLLVEYIVTVLKCIDPNILDSQATIIAISSASAAQEIALPYTCKQLEEIAQSLNQTLAENRSVRRENFSTETTHLLDKVFPHPDAEKLQHYTGDNFAKLLEAAARRGDNHNVFANEVIKRLESDKESLVQNLHSILVIAQIKDDGRWKELKRHAFQKLKDGRNFSTNKRLYDKTLAEELFEYTHRQGQFQHTGNITNTTVSNKGAAKLYILDAPLIDEHRNPIPSALVVLSQDGIDYSAPLPDTSSTIEQARKEAILSFFRHYGELHPYQEIYASKLIDLALERAKVPKGERLNLLKRICAPYFTVNTIDEIIEDLIGTLKIPANQRRIVLTVGNKETGQSITKTHSGNASPEKRVDIIDKVAKYMLNDRQFIDMLAQQHPSPTSPDAGKQLTNAPSNSWENFNSNEQRPVI